MQFRYVDGVKTVEQAVEQAINVASQTSNLKSLEELADSLLAEIQSILTGELTALRDEKGVAKEWNSALEVAIELVRGELP